MWSGVFPLGKSWVQSKPAITESSDDCNVCSVTNIDRYSHCKSHPHKAPLLTVLTEAPRIKWAWRLNYPLTLRSGPSKIGTMITVACVVAVLGFSYLREQEDVSFSVQVFWFCVFKYRETIIKYSYIISYKKHCTSKLKDKFKNLLHLSKQIPAKKRNYKHMYSLHDELTWWW